MTRIRSILAILLCVGFTADAPAQFFPPVFGVPVVGQGGIAFHAGGKRLSIDAFLPLGDPYPAILPVTPTPFGLRQVGPPFLPYPYVYPPIAPGFPFPGYGSIDQRYSVTIINPPGLPPGVGFKRIPDLSGIDLDVEPAARIWGEPPALAKGKQPARKGELVKAPPKPKPVEVAKAAPAPDKKPEIAANQARPPAVAAAPKPEPPPDGQRLNDLGLAAFRAGEYGVAILRFRQAGDADQPVPRALFLRGQAFIAVGKYQEAVELIQLGLQKQPNWPTSGYRPRGELYALRDGEWKDHREQLEQAHAKSPKNADYLFLLGYLSWFDGERDAAVKYFTQARALGAEPRWADAFLKAAQAN
jgi:Flp pilus assembly protein TadD